jgi:hypothetical protein
MQSHWKAALVGGTAILALTANVRAQTPPQPLANQLAPAAGQTPLYDPQQLPAQRGQDLPHHPRRSRRLRAQADLCPD